MLVFALVTQHAQFSPMCAYFLAYYNTNTLIGALGTIERKVFYVKSTKCLAINRGGNKVLISRGQSGPELSKFRGPHQNLGALTQQTGQQLRGPVVPPEPENLGALPQFTVVRGLWAVLISIPA